MIEKEPDWLGPRVFFDVSIAGNLIGRVKIELRPDICPLACENFRRFCTGEYRPKGVPLGYKGTRFHRVVPGFIVQGGDCDTQDGYGCISIYGREFNDEPSAYKFDETGIVAMANSGPNSNGCQFFITMNPAPELNDSYVVIGKVFEGMLVLRHIESVPLKPHSEIPTLDCIISQCGEL
ncbi:peptidyl-prolyl cis-trans isomerase protein [Trichomonas vaginalis G3]|uniref:peptidyl-prolyl cis-trans isomerase protein n=1 Tax=Trichomonas vaginalis (strain ATCC PRA-98 / G3) TaxID=412133 RepID=UPI0021E5C9A1|nr:peptidyl-prolyl cis-trans isomerase protein [Trichomonas vaginalis G3]KAI5516030.1 peptidyl-prolyl cis-trans isomerase protein [Trichomonas vaginalis G3]